MKLWGGNVEVTVPPASFDKSSRRARSRGSSVDSPSTPAASAQCAYPCVSHPEDDADNQKVKLDEAFIDLEPIPLAVAPPPHGLIIEQRFVHISPEEAERSFGLGPTSNFYLPFSLIFEDNFPEVEPVLYTLAEEVLLFLHEMALDALSRCMLDPLAEEGPVRDLREPISSHPVSAEYDS
ncbi:hypothetical protein BGW80DRAFT_1562972 [Lactifluus volemus]|nr:hypothetical protein BGW80DRAFT_1562972 [Lactifluus volemus]